MSDTKPVIGVVATSLNHDTLHIHVSDAVDVCPQCNRGMRPKQLNNIYKSDFITTVWRVFQCTILNCQTVFVVELVNRRHGEDVKQINRTYPVKFIPFEFPDQINAVSVEFESIYNQAMQAEKYGLDKICGSGYRKALEFLIKDFIVFNDNSPPEVIRSKQLAKCISDHIENPRIKDMALRAVWLGNDETHYERLWESKDIEDMKALIKLTVNFIESELLAQQYLESMPGKPKKE